MWKPQRKSGHDNVCAFVCLNKTNKHLQNGLNSPCARRLSADNRITCFNEYKRIAYKSAVIPSTIFWYRVAFMRYTVDVVYKTQYGNNTKSESSYNQINLINGADKEYNAFKFVRIVPSDFRSYKRRPLCITYDRCCLLVFYCEKFVFVKPIFWLVTDFCGRFLYFLYLWSF